MQDFIAGSAAVVEDRLADAYEMLKGAVGVLPIIGEEARLKAKYAQAQADSLAGTATDSGTSILSAASKSVTSLASVASASASSAVFDAISSASSAWNVAGASYSSV